MTGRPPFVLAVGCIPLVALAAYLVHVYPQLPATVATRFDGSGKAIAFSSKQGWLGTSLGITAFVNVVSMGPMFLGLHRRKPGSPAYHDRVERFMAAVLFAVNALQLVWAHTVAVRSLPQPFLPIGIGAALALTGAAVAILVVVGAIYLHFSPLASLAGSKSRH